MSNVKLILDNYLGKNTKYTEKDMGDGSKQVCDLETIKKINENQVLMKAKSLLNSWMNLHNNKLLIILMKA
jgi:hypothetical protein